jgi:hypothetical protein
MAIRQHPPTTTTTTTKKKRGWERERDKEDGWLIDLEAVEWDSINRRGYVSSNGMIIRLRLLNGNWWWRDVLSCTMCSILLCIVFGTYLSSLSDLIEVLCVCPHVITQDLLSSWNFMLQICMIICRAVQFCCFRSGNFKDHFTQRPTLVSLCSVDFPTLHIHSF